MLGHDMERLDATAVEFMANGKILSQVLGDGGGNITVLAYDKTVSSNKQLLQVCARALVVVPYKHQLEVGSLYRLVHPEVSLEAGLRRGADGR